MGIRPKVKTGRLPDFIVVGPPRTGTTWLHYVLAGHVGLPAGIKETQFFTWNYAMGLEWYRAYFRNCPENLPAGEIAPTYFDYPEAPSRSARHIPRCRIICTLRDPVERVYSQYKIWHRIGLITKPFDYARQRSQLAANNSYASNLTTWRQTFGKENVLVVLHQDLRADPQAYLDSICAFIGIAPIDLSLSSTGAEPVNPSRQTPRSMALARFARQLRDWLIRRRFWRLARLIESGTPLWRLFFTGGKE